MIAIFNNFIINILPPPIIFELLRGVVYFSIIGPTVCSPGIRGSSIVVYYYKYL